MNRAETRAAARRARRPVKYARTKLNPVIRAVIEADFKKRFRALKQAAEVQCLASDDTTQIAADAGYLLFITLRALQLDQFDLEDSEVIDGLALMGNALADVSAAGVISQEQRSELVTGMNYLDALVQPLSKESIAVAWYQVEESARKGDIGTNDLNALLSRLSVSET